MDAGPGVASSVDNIMEKVGLKDSPWMFLAINSRKSNALHLL